jgi:toxin YoeB
MSYRIDFTRQAQADIDFHNKSGNTALLKKLLILLEELAEHPHSGTGKPEQLKYELSGLWSRRINSEHRLVYEIMNSQDEKEEGVVVVYSLKGHY